MKRAMLLVASIALTTLAVSCSEDKDDPTPIPVVTAINPTSGEPGDNVTITGVDMDAATSVTFNGVAATIVSNSATEIVATVPEDATTGKVSVTTAGGVGVSPDEFTVVIAGAVQVESISSISAVVGDNITLTGIDMMTVSSVKIGAVEATIVETTETTATVTVGEGSMLGLNNFTIVNNGGTTTTSTETLPFYVIKKIDEAFWGTFDNPEADARAFGGGGADPEESTAHDISSAVVDIAEYLPTAIDGNFFHMEGYSSTTISGSYMTQRFTGSQTAGVFTDFFGDASVDDIYFNVQINFGNLPDGYKTSEIPEDVLCDFRIRDIVNNDDFEYYPTWIGLEAMGYTPDENGWWSLSIPLSMFVDGSLTIDNFDAEQVQRFGIANRRNYGTGGTAGVTVTAADGGVLATTSFDNAIITVGGPMYK
ncbi:IPT/TIG domain-containing protein [Reichenbachiella agarivorans]|uniref:IPT/TIG domain-containing protein n=1 Tax=Reichenbachiella agarivorans TaxID=2979464 RepID=A0ABY6CRX4_9BACT|nr:IPT/TIG domain-containing protein [Reichenbachiella agarivorans]UXP32770.1 IPT/TIG domain-containing protein [Reichenbachiella agarivorans]